VKNRVADVLRMGAVSLLNSDSYPGARYRQLRRNARIPAVAVKAMARYLAVLVYRLLTQRQAGHRGAAHEGRCGRIPTRPFAEASQT
jgi:hypothetical protein